MDPVWHPLDLADCTLEPTARRGGVESSHDSPLEGTGFEPSVPPRKRRPSKEAPRPTIVVSRDDLCLMTPIQLIGPASLVGNSRETFHKSGTNGSNPAPSRSESDE